MDYENMPSVHSETLFFMRFNYEKDYDTNFCRKFNLDGFLTIPFSDESQKVTEKFKESFDKCIDDMVNKPR